MSAHLTLTDANGVVYNFPPSFWLKDHSWGVRSNMRQRAYAHGGRNTGDGYLESRVITIDGALRADTLALLETAERALKLAVLKGGRLTVSDDTVSRYIDVQAPKAGESYTGDYRNERPITITLIAEDAVWKDLTETTKTEVIAATPTDFTVDATGADTLIYPIIEVVADQAADVPSVSLKNLSDGGMLLGYNDPYFVIGDTLVIDCGEGTVKRNGNDTITYLTTARFLRLQPGVNTFRYEGANCTVKVKFRKVYL